MTQMPATESPVNQWLKISLAAPSVLSEAAADLLGVLSGAGVEQSPDNGTYSRISGYFPIKGDCDRDRATAAAVSLVQKRMEELFAHYDLVPGPLETTLIDDQDWATSWKQYFHAFEIAPGLIIKPSWEEYPAKAGQQILEMDPGMAFGTGQHASTQLALSLLTQATRDLATEYPTLLDIGTGTGILAMAGARFGIREALAIDNDQEAVSVAAENVRTNGLDHIITVSATPLEDISGTFSVICANIVHDVLVEMADAIRHRSVPGTFVILAGILKGEQEENLLALYRQQGYESVAAEYREEWVALLFHCR